MNVFFNSVEAWDFSVLDFIQAHMRCPFLDFIMPYITHLGAGGILWIILTVIFLLTRKYRKAGINCAAALLLSLIVVNFAVKPLAARIRPYDINPLIQLLIDAPNDFSFPSGHTSAAIGAAVSMLMQRKLLPGFPMLAAAALIAFSRLYLYVHFPTDVICGALLGVCFAAGGFFISKAAAQKFSL